MSPADGHRFNGPSGAGSSAGRAQAPAPERLLCDSWVVRGPALGRVETFRMTERGQLCRVRLVDSATGAHVGYVEDLAAAFRPVPAPAFASLLSTARRA